jgi:hypothetical protein
MAGVIQGGLRALKTGISNREQELDKEGHHAGDVYFCIDELEKLATWLWKSGSSKHQICDIVSQVMKIYNKHPSIQNEIREFVFSLSRRKIFWSVCMCKKYLRIA